MALGLQVAQDFFTQWGLPLLHERWPGLAERTAAGKVMGSDVLGADDAISRDHNWGPQFHLWMSGDDFATLGAQVAEVLNAAAPNPWRGHKLAGGGDQAVWVHNADTYLNRTFDGLVPDAGAIPWGALFPFESTLYFIRHAAIWHDPGGLFAELQARVHFYPERWHVLRLKEECFRVWHHGEYNFVQRMAPRQDPVATAICLGEFVAGVMRLSLLLEGDYTPYWKWLAHEFRKHAANAELDQQLRRLVTERDIAAQVERVLAISARMHARLTEAGWVGQSAPNPWLLPLLNDHNELDARLRALVAQSESASD